MTEKVQKSGATHESYVYISKERIFAPSVMLTYVISFCRKRCSDSKYVWQTGARMGRKGSKLALKIHKNFTTVARVSNLAKFNEKKTARKIKTVCI